MNASLFLRRSSIDLTLVRRRYRHGCRWFLLLSAIFFAPLHASASKEYEIKAAFLFNFTKFIEWPPLRFSEASDPIIIGVYGENPFGDILATNVRGRRVNGREIQVRAITSALEARQVHLLFVGGAARYDPESLKAALQGSGTVMVTESTSLGRKSGVIILTVEDNKVHFEIDQDAAESTGVKLSSQLLKLATAVRKGSER